MKTLTANLAAEIIATVNRVIGSEYTVTTEALAAWPVIFKARPNVDVDSWSELEGAMRGLGLHVTLSIYQQWTGAWRDRYQFFGIAPIDFKQDCDEAVRAVIDNTITRASMVSL
jgi:hypothetical protein